MERDFEREFRELKQNEIPDLWNRIEAGLSEKKNVTRASQKAIANDNAPDAGKERFEKKDFEKSDFEKGTIKKRSVWRIWGTLIAACVCVVVILPAFSLLIRNKSYSGSGSDAAANTTEAIAEDNAAMDTATAESVESEFTVAEAAEEMIPENGMADSAAAESAEGMAGDVDTADAGSVGAAASTKEEEKAVWNDMEDGQILEAAVIRIQKAETVDDGLFYQAAVEQADTDNILESGTQIALMCDDDTAYDFLRGPRNDKELKEQEIYLVTLCYDAEGGRFVVLTAEIWEGTKME